MLFEIKRVSLEKREFDVFSPGMRKIKSNIHIFECKKGRKQKPTFESLLTSCLLDLIDQFDRTIDRLGIGKTSLKTSNIRFII